MKAARVGASKALSIDFFRRELSKTGLRTEKFQLEVTKPPLSLNGRCLLMGASPSYSRERGELVITAR